MKTTVDGLEMYVGCGGRAQHAEFSYAECEGGWEVLIDFNNLIRPRPRRFAFCTHKNDAEFIVECLSNREVT